jgi:hypothetical protein
MRKRDSLHRKADTGEALVAYSREGAGDLGRPKMGVWMRARCLSETWSGNGTLHN